MQRSDGACSTYVICQPFCLLFGGVLCLVLDPATGLSEGLSEGSFVGPFVAVTAASWEASMLPRTEAGVVRSSGSSTVGVVEVVSSTLVDGLRGRSSSMFLLCGQKFRDSLFCEKKKNKGGRPD